MLEPTSLCVFESCFVSARRDAMANVPTEYSLAKERLPELVPGLKRALGWRV